LAEILAGLKGYFCLATDETRIFTDKKEKDARFKIKGDKTTFCILKPASLYP
jgi:hypothetical protein